MSLFAKSQCLLVSLFILCENAGAVEPANSLVIDSFDYSNASSAQANWKPMVEDRPGLTVNSSTGNPIAEMSAPFVSQADSPRFSIDRKVDLDLSQATSFTLQIKGEGEKMSVQVSLYFHSEGGWYSRAAYLRQSGWRTLTFSKSEFGVEGNPAGWDEIDAVRISIWAPDSGKRDSSFNLKALRAHWNNIAIILPNPDAKEYESSEGVATRITNMLEETGVGADLISVDTLSLGVLGNRPLAVLPQNPRLTDDSVSILDKYVASGGKLFVSYSIPTGIGKMLGFEKGDYFGEKNTGDFAAIQFDTKEIPGLPGIVGQSSWNIITAKPVAYNARVIGQWLDRDGKPTGKPAMLISDRGAYFSHILLGDDPANKHAMLTSILGKLSPALWDEAARNAQTKISRIGHCRTEKELNHFVQNGPGAEKLAESKSAMSHSAKLVEQGHSFEAYKIAVRARNLRAEAYLLSHKSRAVEARAFWNHTGTGAYPGDWDRTAREMAAAGMNMILPNMLWGAQAHYPSDVLPRSKTFEKYGDQIEQCVAAGKRNGVEVHVWKVNFNLGRGVPQEFIDQLRKEDRLQVSVDGEPGDWLNPAHPDNFRMELDAILEVIRNYDIDGFHFDYIRYPGSKNDFSEYSRKKFEADTGNKVKNWPADCYDGPLLEAYTDWRCGNITRLVKAVSEQARKIRPDIKISAAVFRDYPNCRKWVAQDWPLWAKEGYVDFLCPMDYTDDDEKYINWISTQKSLLPEGFPLYPGIGISLRNKTQSIDRVVGQIHLNREVDTGGFTIFDLRKSTLQSVTTGLSLGAGRTKATPPHRVAK